jgi:hypothetical protein
MTALMQGLQERGWTDVRNIRIDTSLNGIECLRKYAAEWGRPIPA